jgi:hypothetical protein
MKKDLILTKTEHKLRDSYSEIWFKYNGQLKTVDKNNIKDENGEVLSWYYHDVYKKIDRLYYDSETNTLWLPKKDLYNKTKCKQLYNRKDYNNRPYVDSLAFFNKSYLFTLIGVKDKVESGLSGLFA